MDKYGYLLLFSVIVISTTLFVFPLFLVSLNSFIENGEFTIANYVKFFSSKMYMRSLKNSIHISLLTTVIIAPIGLFIVEVTRKYRKVSEFVKVLTSLPLVFSSYVFCIALIYIYGRTGIIPIFSGILYSVWGIIFANTLFFLPYFVIPLFSSFEESDSTLEEVAESLGSHGFHKFRKVIFPQVFHGFLTAVLITWLLVFNQISVVLALGAGRTYTLTYQLFVQYEGFQYGMANTIAVVSLLFTLMGTTVFQIFLEKVK